MEETFDELVTKHTRRELEEMALKYGVQTFGGPKAQLAEAILEAAKKQKEMPQTSAQEGPKVAGPKEAQAAEKPKPKEKQQRAGKDGVMAKAASIDNKAAEFQKAGRSIREEGIKEMTKSVREFQSSADKMSKEMHSGACKMLEDGQQRLYAGLTEFKRTTDDQIRENRDSIAKFNSGAREIRSSTEEMSKEFQKAGKRIRDEGSKNLQNGLSSFRNSVDAQIKENQAAISRIDSATRELIGRANFFQEEIRRYQEQDLQNYIRDFYYG